MKPEEKKKMNLGVNFERVKEVLLNFIVPLIALTVTVLLSIFVIVPKFKSIPVLKSDLLQKQGLKQVLTTKLTNLNKLVDFNDIVSQQSDLVNKVLVSEDQVPRLLDQVAQMAQSSGMDVSRLSYSYGTTSSEETTTTKAQFNTVTVSLAGDMGYGQLISFMKIVEEAARFVKVPNLRYSAQISKTGEPTLGVSFAVDSPYLMVQSSAVTDEPVDIDISDQKFIDFINMLKGLKYYEFVNPNIDLVKTEVSSSTPAQ